MAKVILNPNVKKQRAFRDWVLTTMYDKNLTQKQVAKWLEVTPQSVCHKMQKSNFTLYEAIILINKLNPTDEQIIKLFKKEMV